MKFNKNGYQLFRDNGAGANNGNWILDGDERLLRNRQLPTGITIDLGLIREECLAENDFRI